MGKVDTPSNKGKQEGRQAEKREKASGSQTHHPTKGNKKIKKEDELGDKLGDKLGDIRGDKMGDKLGDGWKSLPNDPREGGHTIQQRETRRCTMGDKGRQDKGKQEGRQWETGGDKILGKADTPSNKGKQEVVQWQTRGDKILGKVDTPSNTKADILRKH